jgi:phosphate ABC transporter phosphate-binding protein
MDGSDRHRWEGHVIVCGLQGVGLRTVEQLHRAGVDVVVVDDEPDQRLARIVQAWDVPHIMGSPRIAGVLEQAGLSTARAVVCAERTELQTLETGLLISEQRPDIRVVVQLANAAVGAAVAQVTGQGTVPDVAALAAPSIVEACLGSDSFRIELAGTHFITAETEVNRFASLRALFGSLAPIAVVPADGSATVACPGRDHMVSIGDRVTVLGTLDEVVGAGLVPGTEEDGSDHRHRRQGVGGLLRRVTSVVGSAANRALRLAMVAALALVVVSVVVLRLTYRLPHGGHMNSLTALYFTVETISTVGFGDFSFSGQSTGLLVFGIALIAMGAAMLTTVFALITNLLVSWRIEQSLGRSHLVGMEGHVVLIGLGSVGIRVLEGLQAAGRDVVVVERNESNRFLNQARAMGVPVLIADSTQRQTLDDANVSSAAAVAVLTSDDLTNIETGLAVRDHLGDRWLTVPVVLRVFDRDLGHTVEHHFDFRHVRSTSALAAPRFVGAALGLDPRVVHRRPAAVSGRPADRGTRARSRRAGHAGPAGPDPGHRPQPGRGRRPPRAPAPPRHPLRPRRSGLPGGSLRGAVGRAAPPARGRGRLVAVRPEAGGRRPMCPRTSGVVTSVRKQFIARAPDVRAAFTTGSLDVHLRWVRSRKGAGRAPEPPPAPESMEERPPVDSDKTRNLSVGPRRRTTHLLAVTLVAAGALLAACSSSSTSSTTTTAAPGGTLSSSNAAYLAADLKAPAGTLNASGSTFVQPFFTVAFHNYTAQNQGLQVNYQGVGSGAGITAFESGTVAFAASDVPMAASDLAKVPASAGPVIQIPDILGGVSISYNLPGVTKRIKLDGPTLAGIFDGTIRTWNASQITALNPGVNLPSNPITPEVRADSSGTTYIFSDYLATAAPSVWKLGASKTIAWPSVAVASPKNTGVAASIKSTPYSVGYVELAYALQNNFTYAAVKNAAGAYVVPSLSTVAADADQKVNVSPTDFSIVNGPGLTSYPISGYSWAIFLQKQTNATVGAGVVKVLDWTTHTGGGQDSASSLGYVPLPPAVQNQNRTTLLTVTGPSGQTLLTK